MRKVLAESIGGCKPSPALEAGGTFEERDDETGKEEAMIAREALVLREKPKLDGPFNVEMDGEEWESLADDWIDASMHFSHL